MDRMQHVHATVPRHLHYSNAPHASVRSTCHHARSTAGQHPQHAGVTRLAPRIQNLFIHKHALVYRIGLNRPALGSSKIYSSTSMNYSTSSASTDQHWAAPAHTQSTPPHEVVLIATNPAARQTRARPAQQPRQHGVRWPRRSPPLRRPAHRRPQTVRPSRVRLQ